MPSLVIDSETMDQILRDLRSHLENTNSNARWLAKAADGELCGIYQRIADAADEQLGLLEHYAPHIFSRDKREVRK